MPKAPEEAHIEQMTLYILANPKEICSTLKIFAEMDIILKL